MLTVDASVWVSAFEPADAFHLASRTFLHECVLQRVGLASPTLALLETGCALARRWRSTDKGREAAVRLSLSPLLRLAPLNHALEQHALEIGTALGLRAADAIYAALSVRLDAALVTTDNELLDRTAGYVRTWTPSGWLAAHAASQ